MTVHTTTLATPVGPLALLARDDDLVAAGFSPPERLHARLRGDERLVTAASLGELSAGVQAYLDGDVTALDELPVAQPGGPFRQAAWAVMRSIPPGEVLTYSELAAKAGSPAAVRAAGSACAANLVAPVVPCHRVVRSGGGLGGYYYGLPVKEWLLGHERAHRSALTAAGSRSGR